MIKDLKNKVVWLTGASSGIGEALTYQLNNAGAKLIISARNRDALYKVKANCKKNIIDIHVLPLDLSKTDTLAGKGEDALKIYGRIDYMIHCGGISQRAKAIETKLEIDKLIMDTNYLGTVALTKAVLPQMLKQGNGHLVIISSLVGKFGTPLRTAYAASKHALHGFFDSLRAEIEQEGINITMVCPGFIKTEITLHALTGDGSPQNKMDDAQANGMDPKVCAKKILEAVIANKREVYIGGKETYGVLIKRFFPGIFSKIIQKVKVI